MKKDLLSVSDLTPLDVQQIVDSAFQFKERLALGVRRDNRLAGRVIAMIFEKPSLRTKVAFEVAAASLEATPVFLSSSQILASGNDQHGRESIPDIARNLERYADLILARVYSHSTLHQIANSIQKPVINALCNRHHPTQALADIMAIRWHRNELRGLKVAYLGDGYNVATSLLQLCAMMGVNVSVATPAEYSIPQEEVLVAESLARESGAVIQLCNDPEEAVVGADVLYTDTFISMGQESEQAERLKRFAPFQVTRKLLEQAKPGALFMHCLPAHRGEEVTSEIMDSPRSIVFDQAECRLHVAKALLELYCR